MAAGRVEARSYLNHSNFLVGTTSISLSVQHGPLELQACMSFVEAVMYLSPKSKTGLP